MAINWFPGHMHKAQKEMRALIGQVDLVVEVLDARLPYSSQNPLLQRIRGDKPCIKLLNKSDLSDPQLNTRWKENFEQDSSVKAYATDLNSIDVLDRIPERCHQLFAHKMEAKKTVQIMIMGIPNVGKSTIINALTQRRIAETGNEPAVTKRQQRIRLGEHLVLHDTPGVLWPKFDNQNSAYRLAASGAIKDNVVELEDIAFFLSDYLIEAYPELLKQRFELAEIPPHAETLLETIAAKRGSLKSRGVVDYHKISKIMLTEFRSGNIGRITLETPEMMHLEMQEVEKQLALKAQKKLDRKNKHKKTNR